MLSLKYPKFWLAMGWTLVVLAIIASLLPGGTPLISGGSDKLKHIVGYLGLTIWFTGIYPRSRYWLIAASLVAMGIAMEILQGAMHLGREEDIADVVANVTGVTAGLAFAWLFVGGWAQRVEVWVRR